MIDFDFKPFSYFDGTGPTALIAKLNYPNNHWGDEICLYATPLDGVIFYEAIDSYRNKFALNPEKAYTTLRLQELIFMIETLEVVKTGSEENLFFSLRGIPEAQSLIYPQLKEYFQEKRKNFGFI